MQIITLGSWKAQLDPADWTMITQRELLTVLTGGIKSGAELFDIYQIWGNLLVLKYLSQFPIVFTPILPLPPKQVSKTC